MKVFVIVLFGVLISFTAVAQEEIQVILLSGQSNMVGHGNYDALDDATKKRIEKIGDRVLVTNHKNEPKPLSEVSGTKSKKYNFSKHFGPELFMGLTLAEKYPNQKFLFIKKAVGGTSLYGAWNVNWTQEKANLAERGETRKKLKLFSNHIKNIHINLENLKEKGIKYNVLAAVWLQGESDTNKEITAASYQENLQNLIVAYRKEISIKKLPFIIGQINALPRKYKIGPKQVRDGMLAVATADKNVSIIKTKNNKPWSDFPKHSDDLHYNTEGQKRFGIAFAKAFIKLLE